MSSYDNYIYSPLQTVLSPIVKRVPRYIRVSNARVLPVFTANIITLSRTFLIFPIAWFLKYKYSLIQINFLRFHVNFNSYIFLDTILIKLHFGV